MHPDLVVPHTAACEQVFYASGMSASVPAASRVNTNSIQQLFNRYADPTDGVMLADGVGRFCDDLGVCASAAYAVRGQTLSLPLPNGSANT